MAERAGEQGGVDGRWYVVGLLTVLFVFSTVDRSILSLFAAPVSQQIQLTNAQMGLVLGMGFAVLYSLGGLPIAHLIDTRPRKGIVAAGVFLWSAMTVASAFATGFTSLMVCRAGVAVGEAVLTPAAVSLIADMFPRDKRALPTSIYAAMGGIFAYGSFIVGAGVLHVATPLAASAGLQPWQMTLIMLGVPGMLLAGLFLATVREPRRGFGAGDGETVGAAEFLRYLGRRWRFYLPFILGIGVFLCFSYGQMVWLPTVLTKYHGYTTEQAGFSLGLIGMIAGGVGTLLLPRIAAAIERRAPGRGVTGVLLAVTIIMLPFEIVTPVSTSLPVLLTGIFVTVTGASTWAVLMPLGFQILAPAGVRGRLVALYLLSCNLIGLSIGPLIVVAFSNRWAADPMPLAHGISTAGMIAGPITVGLYLLAFVAVRRLAAEGARLDPVR